MDDELNQTAAMEMDAELSQPSTSRAPAVGKRSASRAGRAPAPKKTPVEEEALRKAKDVVESRAAKTKLLEETPSNMRTVASLVVQCHETTVDQTIQTGNQQEARVKNMEDKLDVLTGIVKMSVEHLTMEDAVQPSPEQLWARQLRLKISNHEDLQRIAETPELLELFESHLRAFVKDNDAPSNFFQHAVYSVFKREFIARCFAPSKAKDKVIDSQKFEINAGLHYETIPAPIWRIFEQECLRRPGIRGAAAETDKNFRHHLTNMKTQRVRDEIWRLIDIINLLAKHDPEHPHAKLARLILIERHLRLHCFNSAPRWDTEAHINEFLDRYKAEVYAEWERRYQTPEERKKIFEEKVLAPRNRERGSFYRRYTATELSSEIDD